MKHEQAVEKTEAGWLMPQLVGAAATLRLASGTPGLDSGSVLI